MSHIAMRHQPGPRRAVRSARCTSRSKSRPRETQGYATEAGRRIRTPTDSSPGQGLLLVGRRTYAATTRTGTPTARGAFGRQYEGPVVVFTHRPSRNHRPEGRRCRGWLQPSPQPSRHRGQRLRERPRGRCWQQCLQAGLLEKILFFLAPVLLGGGHGGSTRPGERARPRIHNGRHRHLVPRSPLTRVRELNCITAGQPGFRIRVCPYTHNM